MSTAPPTEESASTEHAIYMATVSAPTNIAVIKYWGKASVEHNTPINDSLSVTLDQADGLRAVTTVAASKSFTKDRLWLNGKEDESAATNKRFRACVDGVKALATDWVETKEDGVTTVLVSKQDWQTMHVHVSSYNTFPTAAGLASSAAGYAALVASLAELMKAKEEFPGQFTTLARQGSGSACRSLYGGFVAWRQGDTESPNTSSKAEQVEPESHWPDLRALVLVVSDQQKDTSSTAGMKTSVETSLLLQHRASSVVPDRMRRMEAAIHEQDFATFAQLTMQDSNQFHATCLDTYPPIFYMNDVSRSIIRLITAYNAAAGEVRVAYTFDAGPNAVLYTLESHVLEVAALVRHYYFPDDASNELDDPSAQRLMQQLQTAQYILDPAILAACDKTGRIPKAGDVKNLYYTKPGPGPQVLTQDPDTIPNLDPKTGLNTYSADKKSKA